jgi:lactate permease
MWNQVYDPFNNWIFSTLSAALPVVTLLVLIASNKVKAHIAAIIALIVANLVAIFIFTMPSGLALRATVLGAVTGFFPIGWIVLNVIFLYRLTVEKGTFETLQTTIGGAPPIAGCSFCSSPSRSAPSSRAPRASARRLQ